MRVFSQAFHPGAAACHNYLASQNICMRACMNLCPRRTWDTCRGYLLIASYHREPTRRYRAAVVKTEKMLEKGQKVGKLLVCSSMAGSSSHSNNTICVFWMISGADHMKSFRTPSYRVNTLRERLNGCHLAEIFKFISYETWMYFD